jgi:hypothetical protein
MKKPSIIEYTNLLHKYRDPDAEPVLEFVREHASDPVFVRRAKVLKRVFQLKEELEPAASRRSRKPSGGTG